MRKHPGLTFIAVALAASPALAQTASDQAPAAQDSATGSALPESGPLDVIVTANRRNEFQREIANSVTAITGEDLTRRNEVRIQDLVGQVPGLSVEDDTPTLARIVVRGLNAGGAGATVATVVDDVPTNSAGAQNDGSVTTPNFDTYDLQRIEVLRGPQGSLYGATAEGGLVKYVTNPPDLKRFSGSVETGIDGLTAGGIGGSLKGYVNVPLLDGKAALRITASNEWIPGYIDNPEAGKSNSNSGQQYNWRASLLVKPTEELTIRITANRQTTFSNNNNSVQVVGAAATPLTPPANQFDLIQPLRDNTRFPNNAQAQTGVYYADVNYDFGFASLTSLTSYAIDDQKFASNLTDSNLSPGFTYGAGLGSGVYGRPVLFVQRQNNNTGKFNQEVRLASDPGSTLLGYGFDWQAGVYYTHESESQRQFYDGRDTVSPFPILSPALGGDVVGASYTEWAAFGQVTFHITPSVSLDLGGRYSGNDQHSQVQIACCVVLGPGSFLPTVTSNDHDAIYSVAPKWKIDDDTLGYVRIATGYRPGGPNFPIGGLVGNLLRYGSDRTVNYEIGIRRDFFDRKVQVDLTGYYINWKQIQIISTFQTPTGPVNVIGNAGIATSKGVEWSLAWSPVRGLKLGAVGSYTDARLTENAPALGGQSGDFLPFVPDITNSVNIDYSWSAFRDYEGFVSGTWTYVGERYTGFTPSTFVANNHTRLASYNTGSLRAGVENDRYGFEAFIDNISDERAITTYANQGGQNQTGQATLIEPRLIGATLRVKF